MLSWVLCSWSHKAATTVAEFSAKTQLGKSPFPSLLRLLMELSSVQLPAVSLRLPSGCRGCLQFLAAQGSPKPAVREEGREGDQHDRHYNLT